MTDEDKRGRRRSEVAAAASRRNSGRSRGPRSLGGKRASSRNARKHGLRAAVPAQTEADRQWLVAFRDQLLASLSAEQARNLDLVEQVIAAEFLVRFAGAVFAERLVLLAELQPSDRLSHELLRSAESNNALAANTIRESAIAEQTGSRLAERLHAQEIGEGDPSTLAEATAELRRLALYERRFRGQRDRALKRLLRIT